MSIRITANGEVTFNPHDKMYTVWDEVYSEEVCITPHKFVAMAALAAYTKFLDGDMDDAIMQGEEVDCTWAPETPKVREITGVDEFDTMMGYLVPMFGHVPVVQALYDVRDKVAAGTHKLVITEQKSTISYDIAEV